MGDFRSEANWKNPAVELVHVSKKFGERVVLNDVSFQVDPGTVFCLLGRSGAGKSITLKIIIGLVHPDGGRVLIDGTEIEHCDSVAMASVRKKIGFLFQNGALFDSITVAENVAFPLRRHTRKSEEEIRAIVGGKLEEVGLGKEGGKMPSELSGGMIKRAALARALALSPGTLLVDEPSSGLDRITAAEIYRLLLDLKQRLKVAMVIVTHDVIGARGFADRFAVLDRGRIAASGTAEELAGSDDAVVRELAASSET